MVAHHFHQRHQRTGLKKCRPTNRSARFVAPAISAIVKLDVLRRRSSPRHTRRELEEEHVLERQVLVIASITMSTLRRSATTW